MEHLVEILKKITGSDLQEEKETEVETEGKDTKHTESLAHRKDEQSFQGSKEVGVSGTEK